MINKVRKGYTVPQGSGETAGFMADARGNNLVVDFGAGDRQTVAATGAQTVLNVRQRFAVADINTGVAFAGAPAREGYAYRLVDVALIAIGGNLSGADSVDIIATQSGSAVKLFAAEDAALTDDALVKPGTANTAILANGLSYVVNDKNTALRIGKTGGSAATATHVDAILTFVVEKV